MALLATPEAQQEFKAAQEKAMQGLQDDIEGYKKNLLANTPFHLELEKRGADAVPAPQPLSFNNETMCNLADLFAQLTYITSTTKGLSQTDEIPVTVFLGRSTSWLAVMQQNLQGQLSTTHKFIHALVSGLSTEPYTLEQKESYKRYLDTLGFGTFKKDHPILLTDVAETARTLHRFGELLKDTYNFSNIQYIAMMKPGETVNLERARVICLTSKLANIMFAKHSEYARFCCFSQLYPSQWKEWEKYVHGFQPHQDALNLKAQLLEWMESDEGKKQLVPLLNSMSNSAEGM